MISDVYKKPAAAWCCGKERDTTYICRVHDEARKGIRDGGEKTFSLETHMIASTPLQYRSHIERNFGWPACGRPSATVNLAARARTCDIPDLQDDISFPDFPKVEGDRRDYFFAPLDTPVE